MAYSCMLAFAGLPLFFLELSIGQYGGLGPNKLFGRLAPAFKGNMYEAEDIAEVPKTLREALRAL